VETLTAPVAVVAALNLRKRTVVSFGGNRYCRRGDYFSALCKSYCTVISPMPHLGN
jgi:hypothetical protein